MRRTIPIAAMLCADNCPGSLDADGSGGSGPELRDEESWRAPRVSAHDDKGPR